MGENGGIFEGGGKTFLGSFGAGFWEFLGGGHPLRAGGGTFGDVWGRSRQEDAEDAAQRLLRRLQEAEKRHQLERKTFEVMAPPRTGNFA